MNIIIVDCETTGLDPTKDRIVEVAAVLYSTKHRCVTDSFSCLCQGPGNAAESINRIPASAVMSARSAIYAWNRLGDLVDWAECDEAAAVFMAHRASFDRGFIEADAPKLAARLSWVCSKFDLEWPLSKPGASCVEMALAHGVPVVSAHRAMTDCMLIAGTLASVQASGHDLDAMIAQAMRPRSLFMVADQTFDEARNAQAKALGFSWNREARRWEKRMVADDVGGLPFDVKEVA